MYTVAGDSRLGILWPLNVSSSQTGVSSIVCMVIRLLWRSCCQAFAGFSDCNLTYHQQPHIMSSPFRLFFFFVGKAWKRARYPFSPQSPQKSVNVLSAQHWDQIRLVLLSTSNLSHRAGIQEQYLVLAAWFVVWPPAFECQAHCLCTGGVTELWVVVVVERYLTVKLAISGQSVTKMILKDVKDALVDTLWYSVW